MVRAATSRRKFIRNAAMAGMAITAMPAYGAETKESSATSDPGLATRFLFQGDSITDGNRGRNDDPNHILGHGYVFSIASAAGAAFPQRQLQFYNRGISGNKITDLEQRWQQDTLQLQPDVLSILVGINDAESVMKQQGIVSVEQYQSVYERLLTKTKTQVPGCLLVLCEPFILPVGRVKADWKRWEDDLHARQAVVQRLAKKFDAVFIPLQKAFTDACERASPDYWIWDGIHPTYSGHDLVKKAWLSGVAKVLPFLNQLTC